MTWFATFAQGAAQQAAGGILGQTMQRIAGPRDRKVQREQQEKLMGIQMKGEKEMTDYNMAKQLEMWEATGYGAQMKQMKAAGINPALMYGEGGGGGQTANVETGNVTAAPAQYHDTAAASIMGMQTASQIALMQAQIDKTNAEAEAIRMGIPNIPKQGEYLGAQTDLVRQQIKNATAQEQYTQAQTAFQQLETKFAGETYETRKDQITQQLYESMQIVKKIGLENQFTTETWQQAVNQLTKNVIQTELQNELLEVQKRAAEKGIHLTDAQIDKIKADVQQGWEKLRLEGLQGQRETVKLAQTDVDLLLKEMKTQFEITHPGIWNTIGGQVEGTIKQTVEEIKRKIKNGMPKI